MFTIEEESGTYTGTRYRHNGYLRRRLLPDPNVYDQRTLGACETADPDIPSTNGNGD